MNKREGEIKMKNAYVVSVNNAVWSVASSWRKAYWQMLSFFSGCDYELDSYEHGYTYDKYLWVNNDTGELFTAHIDECEIDTEDDVNA